jgi:hypothetical protein
MVLHRHSPGVRLQESRSSRINGAALNVTPAEWFRLPSADALAGAQVGRKEMSGFAGAQYEFHDATFVQGWADRFVLTPPRLALFDLILEHVSAPGLPNAHVLEPGLGQAYIVSTWALHDLGEQQALADVYARGYEVLPEGGVLMNRDFIKADGTSWTYEPGRFEVDRHLEVFRRAGSKEPAFLALFEHNLDRPTSARNYACLIAVK